MHIFPCEGQWVPDGAGNFKGKNPSQDVFELCLRRPMCSFYKPGFHKCLLFYSLHMGEGIECPHFGDFSGNS